MAGMISMYIAKWWQYKGKKKQIKGEKTGNLRLLVEGKRDELAGLIKAHSGCSLRQALAEADQYNV